MSRVSAPGPCAAVLAVLAVLALAGPTPVQPLTPAEVDAEASAVYNSVMSPYCPGVLLAGCGSSAAAVLRDSIRAKVRRGQSRERIVDELVAVYGADILGMPSYTGAGGLVWLLPGLALALGLGGAYWWVRRGRQAPPPAMAPRAPADEALRRRLEAELHERR